MQFNHWPHMQFNHWTSLLKFDEDDFLLVDFSALKMYHTWNNDPGAQLVEQTQPY